VELVATPFGGLANADQHELDLFVHKQPASFAQKTEPDAAHYNAHSPSFGWQDYTDSAFHVLSHLTGSIFRSLYTIHREPVENFEQWRIGC